MDTRFNFVNFVIKMLWRSLITKTFFQKVLASAPAESEFSVSRKSLLSYAEVPIPWQRGWRVSWRSLELLELGRPAMTATKSGISSGDLQCSALEAITFSSVGSGLVMVSNGYNGYSVGIFLWQWVNFADAKACVWNQPSTWWRSTGTLRSPRLGLNDGCEDHGSPALAAQPWDWDGPVGRLESVSVGRPKWPNGFSGSPRIVCDRNSLGRGVEGISEGAFPVEGFHFWTRHQKVSKGMRLTAHFSRVNHGYKLKSYDTDRPFWISLCTFKCTIDAGRKYPSLVGVGCSRNDLYLATSHFRLNAIMAQQVWTESHLSCFTLTIHYQSGESSLNVH
jgi:hypothetical protein